LVAPRGRPRWAARGVGISLHRSHAADAPEDSPNQTKRLKRRELQGKNKAERYLSEGLLKRQRPEGRHLPKIPSAPSGMGITRAAPQSSLTRAGERADKAPSSHLNPALVGCFFPQESEGPAACERRKNLRTSRCAQQGWPFWLPMG
jgi:hypothetical protein